MELELLNKLFLELSQVVTVKTAREIELNEKNTILMCKVYAYENKYGRLDPINNVKIDYDGRSDET